VLRSRSALLAAAVLLVSERGTTAIPVTDIAAAAGVSRQLVYLQFGDRDALLVEAAVDLVRREFVPQVRDGAELERAATLAMARHFAGHRSFYRAMLTGACAFAMTRALGSFLGSFNWQVVRELFGELGQDTARDLVAFLTGGAAAIVNDWLIDGVDPLDPEQLADRFLRLRSVLADGYLTQAEGHA
jgi:AcrR family transcriptional regulator